MLVVLSLCVRSRPCNWCRGAWFILISPINSQVDLSSPVWQMTATWVALACCKRRRSVTTRLQNLLYHLAHSHLTATAINLNCYDVSRSFMQSSYAQWRLLTKTCKQKWDIDLNDMHTVLAVMTARSPLGSSLYDSTTFTLRLGNWTNHAGRSPGFAFRPLSRITSNSKQLDAENFHRKTHLTLWWWAHKTSKLLCALARACTCHFVASV